MHKLRVFLILAGASHVYTENYYNFYEPQNIYPVTYQSSLDDHKDTSNEIMSHQFSVGYQDPRNYQWESKQIPSTYQLYHSENVPPESSTPKYNDPHQQYVIEPPSDGNRVNGQYSVLLPDGRVQIVKYVADPLYGFMADVSYHRNTMNNEHVDSKDYTMYQSSQTNDHWNANVNFGRNEEPNVNKNGITDYSREIDKKSIKIDVPTTIEMMENNRETVAAPSQMNVPDKVEMGYNSREIDVKANNMSVSTETKMAKNSREIADKSSKIDDEKSIQSDSINVNLGINNGDHVITTGKKSPTRKSYKTPPRLLKDKNEKVQFKKHESGQPLIGHFPNFPDTSLVSFEQDKTNEEELLANSLYKYNVTPQNRSFSLPQKGRIDNPKRKRQSIHTVKDEKITYELSTSKSIVSSKRTISEHIVIHSE